MSVKRSAASSLSVGQLAALACIAEVSAPKVGNVHPGAAFDDVTHMDFIASAVAIAPHLDRAAERGVGPTVLACVEATRSVCDSNTNLGMILLLAPLCAVPRRLPLGHIDRVLAALAPRDARDVYAAIRLARPGGLGRARRGDVRARPPRDLLQGMALAADRDAIARQYVRGFDDVLRPVARDLSSVYRKTRSLCTAIVAAHLLQMAREPDSLIQRKCGPDLARQAQRRAAVVCRTRDWQHPPRRQIASLDRWLRQDGHRRNPGTSADLVAAALFVCFRERWVSLPAAWGGMT